MYLTPDINGQLSYQAVVSGYLNNQRGEKQEGSTIPLGTQGRGAWIALTVYNATTNENWVLDFGHMADGRTGLVKSLVVENYTTRQTLFNSSRPNEDAGQTSGALMGGRALPLSIRSGQMVILAVYALPEAGFPVTLAPFISAQDYYFQGHAGHDIFSAVIGIALLLLSGFFIAIAVINKDAWHGVYAVFFALNLIFYWALENSFVQIYALQGEVLGGLILFIALTGLYAADLFLRTGSDSYGRNTALSALGALAIACTILNFALFDSDTALKPALLFVPMALSMAFIAFLSLFHKQETRRPYYIFSAGWAVLFLGWMISGLCGPAAIPAYWIGLLPAGICFIIAVQGRIKLMEEERRNIKAREDRAAQSMTRIQKSKESADQARLLRVIERERELMAELREREIMRTEEMRRAKDMADKANRAKSAFLAVVSHEIRTPMTGIMGIVRLLKDTKLSREQGDFIGAIQTSGDTMMALLNDILDFEKIETDSMQLESIDFDLPSLMQSVVTLMSGHAADKGTTLKLERAPDVPQYVVGDPTRLRQVILNLVSNAIKFTDKGTVRLHLRLEKMGYNDGEKRNEYEIYFAIEDTGIGIPEEAQENLFNPFEQADESVSRKYGGSGLGLAICKRLITAMGGSIGLKSQVGKGSTFFFTLKLPEGQAAKATESPDSKPHTRIKETIPEMNIMVVEDNDINRKVLQSFLQKDGHHVTGCESGEKALITCRENRFDVIFMDVNLTGMSGLETTEKIRGLPGEHSLSTPIIAITGNLNQRDIDAAYESGMNGFIAKPIDYEKLRNTIADVYHGRLKMPEVLADIAPLAYSTPAPPSAPAPMEEEAGFEGYNEEETLYGQGNAISPIQSYLESMEENGEGPVFETKSFEEIIKESEQEDDYAGALDTDMDTDKNKAGDNIIVNTAMLDNLLGSLGKEQTKGLLQSCMDKADEILGLIGSQEDTNDLQSLQDRAHELKGMAANFGITELSILAGQIEKNAAAGKGPESWADAKKLPDANRRAKEFIQNWLEHG